MVFIMASVNNIFLVNENPPVARYVKTIESKVGGIRFDSRGQTEVGFVLESDPTHFDYDSEVLEIYTERENRALKQLNRKLFSEGYLKEYKLESPEVDTRNMLSDEAIIEIASMRNIKSLEARIAELTSPFTIQRILTAATDIGRPAKTVALIQARLDAVK
jgi:hypothetical protein